MLLLFVLLLGQPARDLSMECEVYGKLIQTGTRIQIKGKSPWTATGTLLKNNKVLLYWSWRSPNGQTLLTGIGLYEADENGNLFGAWNYFENLLPEDLVEIHQGNLRPLLQNLDYIQRAKEK